MSKALELAKQFERSAAAIKKLDNLVGTTTFKADRYLYAAAELRHQHAEIAELKAELERMTQCLKKANDQAEDFERRWYLANDELERIRGLEPVAWRSSMGHGVTFKESLTTDQIAFKWAGAPMWQPLFTLPPNLKATP